MKYSVRFNLTGFNGRCRTQIVSYSRSNVSYCDARPKRPEYRSRSQSSIASQRLDERIPRHYKNRRPLLRNGSSTMIHCTRCNFNCWKPIITATNCKLQSNNFLKEKYAKWQPSRRCLLSRASNNYNQNTRDPSSRQSGRPTSTNPQLPDSNKDLVVSPRWVFYSKTDWPADRRS
jgi:hypothetical protein